MKNTLRHLVLVAITALLGPLAVVSVVTAQATDPVAEIELAAARHLRADFAAAGRVGAIGLDRVPFRLKEHSADVQLGLRNEARLQALTRALGGPATTLNEVMLCPRDSRSCRLNGVVAHISLAEPEIRGDSATVAVATWWATGRPQHPVAYSRTELQLVRAGSGWRVVRNVSNVIS